MADEKLPSLRPEDPVQNERQGTSDPRRKERRPVNLRLESTTGKQSGLRAAYAFLYNEQEQLRDLLEDFRREVRRDHQEFFREFQDILREVRELKQDINASASLMVWLLSI
ncbi:hypothetical protein ACJZ2D_016766 [Fusarium nematophilum]